MTLETAPEGEKEHNCRRQDNTIGLAGAGAKKSRRDRGDRGGKGDMDRVVYSDTAIARPDPSHVSVTGCCDEL